MTKQQRRTKELEQHYKTLEQLAVHCGINEPNGKKLSVKLLKIERLAHKLAESWCNGEIDENVWSDLQDRTTNEVQELFNHKLKGFFVNSDPRGHTLKIDDQVNNELVELGIKLNRDWGGYGLLAPEITGN